MSLFSKRRLLAGVAAFVIGVGAYAAIWGMPKFKAGSETVKSEAAAYLLDDRGAVNGLLLKSGDQLRFSPQTGEAVAAQIKVGDEVTATGRAGTKSIYGREVRVEQISANGRSIVEVKHGPKRRPDRHGPKGSCDKNEPGAVQGDGADTDQTRSAQPETVKAAGTIQAHLVNGHGDVDGLILSTGEQVRFSPKAGQLVAAAERGADTLVSVEGAAVRNERGTVLRPTLITVGNQTISLGR